MPASVDAIVTDPPYDLLSASRNGSRRINNPDNPGGRTGRGFMGKTWDGTGIAFRPETWAAMLQVAKPGAYLLAFGGTRTYHRMVVAIEDGGWLIRDCLVWVYAQGFPKSRANLKPAWEPIVLARKRGPLRRLAIDACRIPATDNKTFDRHAGDRSRDHYRTGTTDAGRPTDLGRWPANVILTDPIFDGGVEGVVGGGETGTSSGGGLHAAGKFEHQGRGASWVSEPQERVGFGDDGTYSRFFLIPKADRDDREPVLGGPVGTVVSVWGGADDDLTPGKKSTIPRRNTHPTVKPTELMRHLVRLVTPAGGTVLDPFLGSGTTAIAAELEGFPWIGIEREAEYVAIAEARLNGTQRGMGLAG
jgi:site-specific DNA-methyltransferase (adenine-specific)